MSCLKVEMLHGHWLRWSLELQEHCKSISNQDKQRILPLSQNGCAHLNAFAWVAASLSSFSFFAGGVAVRLEVPDSSPPRPRIPGPMGFL